MITRKVDGMEMVREHVYLLGLGLGLKAVRADQLLNLCGSSVLADSHVRGVVDKCLAHQHAVHFVTEHVR